MAISISPCFEAHTNANTHPHTHIRTQAHRNSHAFTHTNMCVHTNMICFRLSGSTNKWQKALRAYRRHPLEIQMHSRTYKYRPICTLAFAAICWTYIKIYIYLTLNWILWRKTQIYAIGFSLEHNQHISLTFPLHI